MAFAFTPPAVDIFDDSRQIVAAQFSFKNTTFTQDNQEVHDFGFRGDFESLSFQGDPVIVQVGPIPRGYVGRQADVGGIDIANPSARAIDKLTQGRVNYSDDPMPTMSPTTFLKKI